MIEYEVLPAKNKEITYGDWLLYMSMTQNYLLIHYHRDKEHHRMIGAWGHFNGQCPFCKSKVPMFIAEHLMNFSIGDPAPVLFRKKVY